MIVSLSKIKSYYHFDVRTIIIMNKIKDGKIDLIVKEAVPLFLEKSISDISMNEIAKFVGVGEATLYRYFQKKQNLVIQISAKLADEVFNHYFSLEQKLSGYEQISDSDRNANLYQKHEKVRAIREKELTLIPYYAWANRGENEMQVWIRYER